MIDIHNRIDALHVPARTIIEEAFSREPEGYGMATTDTDITAAALVGHYAGGGSKWSDQRILKRITAWTRKPMFAVEMLRVRMHYGRHVRHRTDGSHYHAVTSIDGIGIELTSSWDIGVGMGASRFDLAASATRRMPWHRDDGYLPRPTTIRASLSSLAAAMGDGRRSHGLRAAIRRNGIHHPVDGGGALPAMEDMDNKDAGMRLVMTRDSCILHPPGVDRSLVETLLERTLVHARPEEMPVALKEVVRDVRFHRDMRPVLLPQIGHVATAYTREYAKAVHIRLKALEIHQDGAGVIVRAETDVIDRHTLMPRGRVTRTDSMAVSMITDAVRVMLIEDQILIGSLPKGARVYAAVPDSDADVDPSRHMIERTALNALTSRGEDPLDAIRKAVMDCHLGSSPDGTGKCPVVRDDHGLDLIMDHGRIRAAITFTPGVRWIEGMLVLDQLVPETVAGALVGQPLRSVVDHPWLDMMKVRKVTPKGKKTLVRVDGEWVSLKGE